MSKKPLYRVIFQYFKEKILLGEIKPGDQLPTELEITKHFNVSRITVTRALKELELSKFIHRIQGSGSYVNDGDWKIFNSPDGDNNKLSIISLVLPFGNNFSSDFLRGIEHVAKQNNYFVTYHNSSGNPRREKKVINDIISSGSHGIILYPTENPSNMELYTKLIINKFPVVLIDKRIPGLEISLVCTDNKKNFYDLTSHLLEIGHEKIIFIGTAVHSISSEYERYKGFCQAHIDHGVPLLNKHMFSNEDIALIPPEYRPNETFDRRACNYLFDFLENLEINDTPTAIAAVNDYLAGFIISTALEREISIPSDYSVTGFDNIPLASHLQVPLTTIGQPIYEIGRVAALELFESIKSPGNKPVIHNIDGKLIIRESTKSIIHKKETE